jgi:hypothetical protein
VEKINLVKYEYVKEYCGEPGEETDMVKIPFPFALYLNGDKNLICRNFYGNKKIARAVIDAYQEILDYYGIDFIRKNGIDNYGGCFENRNVRGKDRPSDHSWGMAVDVMPQLGALGEPSMIPFPVVNAFIKRGFICGYNWKRKDGMHITGII